MCVIWYSTPDGKPSALAKGLNLELPDLSDVELFWVIKNGIRMAGSELSTPKKQASSADVAE